LKHAYDAIQAAEPLVPDRCRLMFDSEAITTEWFYRTARTEANFYESCRIRDQLDAFGRSDVVGADAREETRKAYQRWVEVLRDEQANAEAALPLLEEDPRLDPYHRGDHSLSHSTDMLKAKLAILDHELHDVLPRIAKDIGLNATC
jgi:hypothetical protein